MSESKIYNWTEWTELNFFCGKGTETIFTQKHGTHSWGGILARQWSFFKTFHAKDPQIYDTFFLLYKKLTFFLPTNKNSSTENRVIYNQWAESDFI